MCEWAILFVATDWTEKVALGLHICRGEATVLATLRDTYGDAASVTSHTFPTITANNTALDSRGGINESFRKKK